MAYIFVNLLATDWLDILWYPFWQAKHKISIKEHIF